MILMIRQTFPVFLLVITSFIAFWLPVHQGMPRVTVGFVSFLSLTHFRNQAYAILPQKASSLMWIDVAMFTITEVVWFSVIENVLAQVVHAHFSHLAARFVDVLARLIIPLLTLVLLSILFVCGRTNV